jgi:DNA-binding CsgD family transcriptional regulator
LNDNSRISRGLERRSIVIVERFALLRLALSQLIRQCPALELGGEFPDWAATLASAKASRPAPFEIFLSPSDPRPRWTREEVDALGRAFPGALLVVCAGSETRGSLPTGWSLRCVPPDASPRQFFLACGLEARLARSVTIRPAQSLSDRERHVYLALARGEPLKQIAHELQVTASTVNVFRKRALTKLGLTSDSELVRHAVSVGLVPCQWERCCARGMSP